MLFLISFNDLGFYLLITINLSICHTNIYQLSHFLAFILKIHQQLTRTKITIKPTKLYSIPKRSNKYYLVIS